MWNTLWHDFKMEVLYSSNMVNKLIAINIIVFIVFGLLYVFIALFGGDMALYADIRQWVAMPSNFHRLLIQPWGIITYQFIHAGLLHIAFNMLVFILAGRIFREFLGDKKLLATYLMGGIAGGLFFAIAYTLLPIFRHQSAIVVGASASIIAVLTAAATLVPNYTVHLILIGPIKLIYITLALILLSVLSLAGGNAGGEFAHIGGVIYGFAYIKALQNGYDLTGWLVKLFDKIGSIRRPGRKHLRKHYVNKKPPVSHRNAVTQEEIDRILDKISKSGYEGLSNDEKDVLFKASNQK